VSTIETGLELTRSSYNSAVFYIGANNEYDIHVIQMNSEAYNDVLANSSNAHRTYDMIDSSKWSSVYDTPLVGYGTLFLAVDEYRSKIDNDTLTGKPKDWPNVPTEIANAWSQDQVDWNLDAPLIHELGSTSFVQDISDTGSVSRAWIRMDTISANSASTTPNKDPPKFAHVSQAFAKRLDTASRIQLSFTFLVIVIVCNSVKLLTMLWVVFMERKEYIVTLGDGAASFLERPDPITERMCILSKQEITREVADTTIKTRHNDHLSQLVKASGKRWTKQSTTYSNALNRDRELGSYFM
jgi:hypothetical protein